MMDEINGKVRFWVLQLFSINNKFERVSYNCFQFCENGCDCSCIGNIIIQEDVKADMILICTQLIFLPVADYVQIYVIERDIYLEPWKEANRILFVYKFGLASHRLLALLIVFNVKELLKMIIIDLEKY